MTHWMIRSIAVLGVLVWQHAAPLACGDKYYATSRGTRFERSSFVRPKARILVYAPSSGSVAAAVRTLGLEQALTKVGYTPVVVDSEARLSDALRTSHVDVVLFDLADRRLAAPAPQTQQRRDGPASIAIALKTSGEDVKQAKRELDAVLRTPARGSLVVDAIDQVLFERAKAGRNRQAGT